MLCETLIKNLGFDCEILEGPSSEGLRIMTPVDFQDGTPFYFYIQEHKDGNLLITDEGETLFHFISSGLVTNESRSWKSLKNIADKSHFNLSENGCFIAFPNQDQKAVFMGRALELGFLLKEWESERLGKNINDIFFVDEVEMALRAWKPGAEIIKRPKVVGYSKKEYEFNFNLDGILIDALQPNSRSTGSKLRKILDIQQGPYGPDMLFVLDDRTDPLKARTERDLIGGLTKAIFYSDLQTASYGDSAH